MNAHRIAFVVMVLALLIAPWFVMQPALGFLVFVAIAALAAKWAEGRFGQSGIAVLLLIVGSMDVDVAIITLGGLSAAAIAPLPAAMAMCCLPSLR